MNRNIIEISFLLALSSLLLPSASAQDFPSSDHALLAVSSSLEFDTMFQAALSNTPEFSTADVRASQADAYTAVGESWLSGRPSWEINYVDDGLLDDVGLREMESGVRFNLWRRGERQGAQALGVSYDQQFEAWSAYLQLKVAGEVRAVLAKLSVADAMLDLERQATVDARSLVEMIAAMFDAGAVPQLDVLQAESLLLEQVASELHAEADLVDAEREYATLTGLGIRPAMVHTEEQSSENNISAGHPLIRYLRSEVDLAQNTVTKIKQQAGESPSMTLGVRRERGSRLEPYNDSFGVSFSVPFGKSASAAANVSGARIEQANAEVRMLNTRRALQADLHEAEHQLYLIAESLLLSESQAQINSQRQDMALVAFESGETEFPQVVIAMQQARESTQDYERLKLDQQRLITEFNQVIGIVP